MSKRSLDTFISFLVLLLLGAGFVHAKSISLNQFLQVDKLKNQIILTDNLSWTEAEQTKSDPICYNEADLNKD